MTRRRWRITLLAALATVSAIYPITTLFSDSDWFPQSVVIIGLVAGLGVLVRGLTRTRILVPLAQLAVVGYVVLRRFAGDTFDLGIPTRGTWDVAGTLGAEALDTIQRYTVPAPLNEGVTFSLVCAIALLAIAVDALAATWRSPAAAGLPLLTAYLITAANGQSALDARFFIVPVAVWLLMLHTTARAQFSRWSTARFNGAAGDEAADASALRSLSLGAVRLGAVAVAVALVVAAVVPHFPTRYLTEGLGRTSGSGGEGTVGFSTTLDLTRSLNNSDRSPILKYTTTGIALAPLRVLATSYYTRGEWLVAGRSGATPAQVQPLPPPSQRHDYVMQVSNNTLAPPRLAAPYPVVSAETDGSSWRFDTVTRDVIVNRPVESYTVTYADLAPLPAQLREAGPPNSPDITEDDLRLPAGDAEFLRRWAASVTAGADNAFDKAIAIQDQLRDQNRYTYSLDVGGDVLDQNGRPLDPIRKFYTTRRGYCVQFATAMIMMARAEGIPARMAIGFLPGRRVDNAYQVIASDAHSWPELYFQGYGWIRFEPTPGSRSGSPPAYTVAPVGPVPTGVGREASATGAAPSVQANPNRGEADREASTGTAATTSGWSDLLTGRSLVTVVTILVILLALFLMPLTAWVARLRRRRRAATRQEIVEIEWESLISRFDDLGLTTPAGATLRSARKSYISEGHLDQEHRSAMQRVTTTLERSRYDRPERTTPEDLEALHRDIRTVRRQVTATRSLRTRLRSFFWPTAGVSVWRRMAGRLSSRTRQRT